MCALCEEADAATYKLSAVGPIDFATRLCGPRKDKILHAIVSWRSKQDLALYAFINAADSASEGMSFKEFFALEARLNKKCHEEPTGTVLDFDVGATPSKKHRESMIAARDLATPEPWVKRNRCE